MSSIKEYLDSLPDEQRKTLSKVRTIIRKNLPSGYMETFNCGMISYEVPLTVFPDTYNKKPLLYCALAANKNKYSLHLMNVYGDKKLQQKIEKTYKAAGKKLDMGKGCLRFKSLDDLPPDLVAELIAATPMEKFIAAYKKVKG